MLTNVAIADMFFRFLRNDAEVEHVLSIKLTSLEVPLARVTIIKSELLYLLQPGYEIIPPIEKTRRNIHAPARKGYRDITLLFVCSGQ
jgi:hypothetical protein